MLEQRALCSLLYGYILNLLGESEGLEKKISFFFQTAERMSAPLGEAAKVRLPQRLYGAAPVRAGSPTS